MRKTAISFNYLDSTIHGILSMPETQRAGRVTGVIIPSPSITSLRNSRTSILQNVCTLLPSNNTATFSFNQPESLPDQHGGILAAALDVFTALPQISTSIFLVTYSHDANSLIKNFSLYRQATGFIFISPTPSRLETVEFLNDQRAMLFLVGENDKKSDWMEITDRLDGHKSHVSLKTIADADHSWSGFENYMFSSIPLSARTPGKVNHD